MFKEDRRELFSSYSFNERWGKFFPIVMAGLVWPLLTTFGFALAGDWRWQAFWFSLILVAMGVFTRYRVWRRFRSSRLSLALHPIAVAYEAVLALSLLFPAKRG